MAIFGPIGLNEDIDYSKLTKAKASSSSAKPKKIFGQDVDTPLTKETSKEFVLGGVEDFLKKGFGRASDEYKKRGYGSQVYAPAVKETFTTPMLETGAGQIRKGLMDIERFEEGKRQFDVGAALKGEEISEAGNYARQQKDASERVTILCTHYYKKGWLSFGHIKADVKYLKNHVSRATHQEYIAWAAPLTKKLEQNYALELVIFPLVYLWGYYMKKVAYKQNYGLLSILGLVIHTMGITCGKLYKLTRKELIAHG